MLGFNQQQWTRKRAAGAAARLLEIREALGQLRMEF
jgi:hypothetical protein